MPSLIKKRGTMRYRASVTVNGMVRQKVFKDNSQKSKREAYLWEEKVRKELEEEQSKTSMVSLAVGDWINQYLEEAEQRFAKVTFDEKKAAFTKFFTDTGLTKDSPIENVTLTVCRNYLIKQNRERSGNAANKDRKNLGAAWKWGLDYLDQWPKGVNPILSIKKFPEKREPRYVPPEEDFWKVFELTEGQDRVMLLCFLHLAARRSEVFHLKWTDVDFNNSRVRLYTQKREGGNQECDWLPMTMELRSTLLKWWEARLAQSTDDKEHVFVCLDNSPFCDEYFGKPFKHRQHVMKKICNKANVKHFGFHAIRHLSASILYKKGNSVSIIQAILRHKNPNTTTRYLRTIGLEDTRSALEEGFKKPAEVIPFSVAVNS
jgi:integrase